jgi:hypothetical protein
VTSPYRCPEDTESFSSRLRSWNLGQAFWRIRNHIVGKLVSALPIDAFGVLYYEHKLLTVETNGVPRLPRLERDHELPPRAPIRRLKPLEFSYLSHSRKSYEDQTQ